MNGKILFTKLKRYIDGGKVYDFELYTNHERLAGEVLGEYLTKEEMIMMAQGMCRGAAMLKSFVTVRVKEEGVKGYVYATKSK